MLKTDSSSIDIRYKETANTQICIVYSKHQLFGLWNTCMRFMFLVKLCVFIRIYIKVWYKKNMTDVINVLKPYLHCCRTNPPAFSASMLRLKVFYMYVRFFWKQNPNISLTVRQDLNGNLSLKMVFDCYTSPLI